MLWNAIDRWMSLPLGPYYETTGALQMARTVLEAPHAAARYLRIFGLSVSAIPRPWSEQPSGDVILRSMIGCLNYLVRLLAARFCLLGSDAQCRWG